MKEQQELKEQLIKNNENDPSGRSYKSNAGLSKKSSERVPRRAMAANYHIKEPEPVKQNPRQSLNLPL